MLTNETRSQDSTTITIAGNGTEVIDDTPDWEGPFTECGRYGEPTGYNCIWCPVCGAEVLNGKTSTVSHRPACRYE